MDASFLADTTTVIRLTGTGSRAFLIKNNSGVNGLFIVSERRVEDLKQFFGAIGLEPQEIENFYGMLVEDSLGVFDEIRNSN